MFFDHYMQVAVQLRWPQLGWINLCLFTL